MMTGQILYSRYHDGSRPVRVRDDGWEVLGTEGRPQVFTTAQALLAELTGHPTGRHWSLDRYFALGDYAPPNLGQADVLDLFGGSDSFERLSLEPLAPSLVQIRSCPSISIPGRRRITNDGPVVVSGAVGIDLSKRYIEVRKLMFKGFGSRIRAAGYDPEEVLQEVYRGLLARNQGTCPWDPSKSSFGHYVHMVISCVLSNYHRKKKRIRQVEQVGLGAYNDGHWTMVDVAAADVAASEVAIQADVELNETAQDLVAWIQSQEDGDSTEAIMAVRILPYVAQGTPRKQIAARFDVSMAAISRAVSYLRRATLAWHSLNR